MFIEADKLGFCFAYLFDTESVAHSEHDLLVLKALELGVTAPYGWFYRYFHAIIIDGTNA